MPFSWIVPFECVTTDVFRASELGFNFIEDASDEPSKLLSVDDREVVDDDERPFLDASDDAVLDVGRDLRGLAGSK